MCQGYAPSLLMIKTFNDNDVSFKGRTLSDVPKETFLFESNKVVNQICHGMIVYGLFTARSEKSKVEWDDVRDSYLTTYLLSYCKLHCLHAQPPNLIH
jgi:hypothetical protein